MQHWAAKQRPLDRLARNVIFGGAREPSSLPVLLAGLGLIGGAFYLKRKKVVPASNEFSFLHVRRGKSQRADGD
jgi:hypothetical protein